VRIMPGLVMAQNAMPSPYTVDCIYIVA